ATTSSTTPLPAAKTTSAPPPPPRSEAPTRTSASASRPNSCVPPVGALLAAPDCVGGRRHRAPQAAPLPVPGPGSSRARLRRILVLMRNLAGLRTLSLQSDQPPQG